MERVGNKKYIKLFTASVLAALVLVFVFALWLSRPAAQAAPNVEGEERSEARIVIVADGKEFVYTDEEIVPSDFTVAEEIEKRRINASLKDKIELVDMLLSKGADHKTALGYPFPLLHRTVEAAADRLYVAPVDATVVYRNGVFSVTRDSEGRMLDADKLYAALYCALKYDGGGTVKASAKPIAPGVTAAELKKELVLRASYTTDFSSSKPGRAHNVALALKKLDGARLEPGQKLSFNDTVGARSEENGFKSAKMIVDGKYIDGVGGGVCQASTALYNAAVLAGLSCAANAHSICPSYCPPGLDAMISSVSDLVITNTTSRTVYFSARSADGRGTVKVYGEKSEYTIVPESIVDATVPFDVQEMVDIDRRYFDASAVPGESKIVSQGREGIYSRTFLNYFDASGKKIKRVLVRRNEYRPCDRIVAVAP